MKSNRFLLPLIFAGALLHSNETKASLIDGLLARYQLNGNAQDASGNGLNGTLGNVSFASDRFGVANKAASFNGTPTSYISINTHALDLAPAFTVSAWVNFTAGIGIENPRIFSTAGYELGVDSVGTSRTAYFNNTTATAGAPTAYSSSPVQSGLWNHLVGVREGNELRLYVNGNLAASVQTTEPPDYSRNLIPTIGVNSGAYSQDNYGGLIDDVRIYGRSLSDVEVQQLFQIESVPEPSVLALAVTGLVFVLARRRN